MHPGQYFRINSQCRFLRIAIFVDSLKFLLLSCILTSTLQAFGHTSDWWDLGLLPWRSLHHHTNYYRQGRSAYPITRHREHMCLQVNGLTHSQIDLCQRYFDHMPMVSIGAKLSLFECRQQFKYRHWNCSSPSEHRKSAFSHVTKIGGREAGFAHAISAAGVVHVLARSCKEGRLYGCGCSKADRPDRLHRDWVWGGCGDNIAYAYRFAKAFIDMREKEKSHPRHSPELGRMLMNLHNNRAGRLAVFKMASVACKCHGVSGSCSMRTCWTQMTEFPHVGRYLRHLYDSALQVKFNRRGTKLRPVDRRSNQLPTESLIYLNTPADHCSTGNQLGHKSTQGRHCIPEVGPTGSNFGGGGAGSKETSCNKLCCGRGYSTELYQVSEKCNCHFRWCCKLECQTCVRMEQRHVCN